MLRDALRLHPNLACPEETHYFRWSEPFGTESMIKTLVNNPILKRHRQLDGITEDEFSTIIKKAESRRDVYRQYMALYLERNKPEANRWFDKTPQNVYGAFLAAAQFPHSKFVHIVRNPLNVVASLRIGKVMSVPSIVGATNYWTEAVAVIKGLKKAFPNRIHELRYEDFVASPTQEIHCVLDFLGEPFSAVDFASFKSIESDHQSKGILTPAEVRQVIRICGPSMAQYGYTNNQA
jgi:hypothetical protein